MKKILIAPLDWGLGHATRCIPIITELLKRDCLVFIAGSGDSLALLRYEFPDLISIELPGYQPAYPYGHSMMWKMAIQIPKFIHVIRNEHRCIKSIIEGHKIDLIISDNRYGCWSASIPSVFITHQLNILMPKGWGWIARLVGILNHRLIKKFTYCWIPDYPDMESNLSGALSTFDERVLKHVTHIGPLSRFNAKNASEYTYDILCIFSGPEPQRSIFEKKVIGQLDRTGLRYFIVRGVLGSTVSEEKNEASFLNSEGLQSVMAQSSCVIARSGYSTIMDLAALGKKGILVPTPGQTEQEYLADRWKKKGILYTMPQKNFDLSIALKESKLFRGFRVNTTHPTQELLHAFDQILSKI
jgi:uncharacterized protein (TIGR00661 family)